MKDLPKLHFGNKGFVFSLDMLIGVMLLVIILGITLVFLLRTYEDPILSLQANKIGGDIAAALDYNEKFDSLNKNTIISNIESVLPPNYNMSFRIECKDKIIQNIEAFPDSFVASGERVLVTKNLDFCKMRYWLWLN